LHSDSNLLSFRIRYENILINLQESSSNASDAIHSLWTIQSDLAAIQDNIQINQVQVLICAGTSIRKSVPLCTTCGYDCLKPTFAKLLNSCALIAKTLACDRMRPTMLHSFVGNHFSLWNFPTPTYCLFPYDCDVASLILY